MAINFNNVTVTNKPMARGTAISGDAQAGVRSQATQPTSRSMAADQASFSVNSKVGDSPDYPTVGEYVQQKFDEKVNQAVDGLHAAAETVPPVLITEIAAIHAKHKKAALEQIWNLPMDPQGKWKVKAQQIMDAEEKKADAEVNQLPLMRAFNHVGDAFNSGVKSVGSGFSWLGGQISAGFKSFFHSIANGFQSAGNLITHGANYVLDGFVSTGVAIGKGVEQTGIAIQNGSRAAGQSIRNTAKAVNDGVNQAYDATAQGVTWLGNQAVELPKAAARGALHEVNDFGQSLVDFSNKAEPLFAPSQN